jgi:hypothetical protein
MRAVIAPRSPTVRRSPRTTRFTPAKDLGVAVRGGRQDGPAQTPVAPMRAGVTPCPLKPDELRTGFHATLDRATASLPPTAGARRPRPKPNGNPTRTTRATAASPPRREAPARARERRARVRARRGAARRGRESRARDHERLVSPPWRRNRSQANGHDRRAQSDAAGRDRREPGARGGAPHRCRETTEGTKRLRVGEPASAPDGARRGEGARRRLATPTVVHSRILQRCTCHRPAATQQQVAALGCTTPARMDRTTGDAARHEAFGDAKKKGEEGEEGTRRA